MELCPSIRSRRWRSESPPWKKPKVKEEFFDGLESRADQIYDVDLPDEFLDDTCEERRLEARSEPPADKNPKRMEDLDGWEDINDKILDMGLPDDSSGFFDDLCVGMEPETAEQLKKHYRAFFECRGYDSPVPPPKGWEESLFRVVDLNDIKELRLMEKAAEHALSLYNDRRGKALKLCRVCHVNYIFCYDGRALLITFEAEVENGSRATYQTRVISSRSGKHLEVAAFRLKPM